MSTIETSAEADETTLLDEADAGEVDHSPRTRRRHDERGANLVEYALLIALIAIVCIGAVSMFGGETSDGPRGVNRSASMIVNAGTP
jgi:hypothetical protein